MIFVWGSYKTGRTDEVPSLFYVVTRFGHLWFLPLLPMESFLLIEGDSDPEGNLRGVSIPLSGKSVLLGWARAGTLITAIVSGIIALASKRSRDPYLPWAVFLVSLGLCLWFTFGRVFRRASYERARELGALLGMNRRGTIMLDLAFGRLSEVEAGRRMRLEDERELEESKREEETAEVEKVKDTAGSHCVRCRGPLGPLLNEWTVEGFCSKKCRETF